jgi:DNA-binding NarL/FixJ family response regulator
MNAPAAPPTATEVAADLATDLATDDPAVVTAGLATLRVAIVEDDMDFLDTLVAAVGAEPGMAMVGSACSRAAGLRLLDGPVADVLLVDLGLPDGSGIDVIHAAVARWPACGVMVSTAFGDEAHVIRSIEAGAAGYLLKHAEPASLVEEIRSLHAGGSPISPLIARQMLMRLRAPPAAAAAGTPESPAERRSDVDAATLSAREHEVLQLITRGYTADEIAAMLQISRHTALTYVRRIYSKLKVNSKAEAIFEARQRGLLG